MNLQQLKNLKVGSIIKTETMHYNRNYKILEVIDPKTEKNNYQVTIQSTENFDNEPMTLDQVWFVGVNGNGNKTRKIEVL